MSTLILADHDNDTLAPSCACLVSAAQALGGEIAVLVAGSGCKRAAEQAARLDGVSKVIIADDESYREALAEPLAALLATLAPQFRTVVASTGTMGKDILPRAAALCDSAQISEVVAVRAPDTFVRSAHAGNALETIQSIQRLTFVTIRASSFDSVGASGAAPIVEAGIDPVPVGTILIGTENRVSERPDLRSARVVVSGGRALGSRERFEEVIFALADKLNAAIGASRAAVDAGYITNDHQVGQTGKIVAPELYIACGISGAVQHLAGIKDSKVIVAINSDSEAPIFQNADYWLVADIFEAVPELTAKL